MERSPARAANSARESRAARLGFAVLGTPGLVEEVGQLARGLGGVTRRREPGQQTPREEGAVTACAAIPALGLLQEGYGDQVVAAFSHDPSQRHARGAGHPDVAGALGRGNGAIEGRDGRIQVAALLLDAAERRQVERGLPEEPEALGLVRRMSERLGRVVEAVLGLSDGADDALGVDDAPGVRQRRQERERLVGRPRRAVGVTEHDRAEGREQQARGRLPRQIDTAVQSEAGRRFLDHVRRPALLDAQERQVATYVGRHALVPEAARKLPRFVQVRLGQVDVAGRGLEPAGEQPPCGRQLGLRFRRGAESGTDPGSAGDAVAEHHPGPAEPDGEAGTQHRVVLGAPGESGVDVRPFDADEGQAVALSGTASRRATALCLHGEPGGVGRAGDVLRPASRRRSRAKARIESSSR